MLHVGKVAHLICFFLLKGTHIGPLVTRQQAKACKIELKRSNSFLMWNQKPKISLNEKISQQANNTQINSKALLDRSRSIEV